jgi:hypothetical protein
MNGAVGDLPPPERADPGLPGDLSSSRSARGRCWPGAGRDSPDGGLRRVVVVGDQRRLEAHPRAVRRPGRRSVVIALARQADLCAIRRCRDDEQVRSRGAAGCVVVGGVDDGPAAWRPAGIGVRVVIVRDPCQVSAFRSDHPEVDEPVCVPGLALEDDPLAVGGPVGLLVDGGRRRCWSTPASTRPSETAEERPPPKPLRPG